MDFVKLSNVIKNLEIDQRYGLKLIQGSELAGKYSLLHTPAENAIYSFEKNDLDKSKFAKLVEFFYSSEYQLIVIFASDNETTESKKTNVMGLKETLSGFIQGYIFFPADPTSKSLLSFIDLIAHLRSPEGCPWDRRQSHESLRTNLLEETYEVLDAIDEGNMVSLQEELGDLLLQIVLQSQIASEEGEFDIYDVIKGIHDKLVFRHPHVFSNWDVRDASAVMRNWEILKAKEKEKKGVSSNRSILQSVPKNLPALSLAQKYQERAARVGFDWPDIAPVIEKIEEEIGELKEAPDSASQERELGDLLFALVNLIRWYGLDAESVLRQMNQRFLKRFNFIENTVASQDKRMTDLTLAEMDEIWERAKQAESK